MQQDQQNNQQSQINQPTPKQQNYTTHISELISQPAANNVYAVAAGYILSSLYQLSSYLFTKKLKQNSLQHQSHNNEHKLDFNSYLQHLQEDLGKFQKIKTLKKDGFHLEKLSMESDLVRCYEKVQRIYFEDNYVLDLSYFQAFYAQIKSKQNRSKSHIISGQIEKLCESLDLVQINLFSQIHCKFEQYFKVVANFEYLKQSVSLHLLKLKTSRSSVQRVRCNFIDKSITLRQKILKRQNIQKLVKLIKQIKSIQKLPQVLQSILASSLPYESLSLLQDTKGTISSMNQLACLKNTSESVKNMQNLVQNDLTKRYTTQLYIYLQQCHNKGANSLQQTWEKIEVSSCLDKDSSFVLDQLNSSTNSALSDKSQMLSQVQIMDIGSQTMVASTGLITRLQGKQYQIAMILLQSYKYVSFSPEVTKIKICNALRVFAKRFEKELLAYLNKVVASQIQSIKQKEKSTQISQERSQQDCSVEESRQSQENQNSSADVVQKISVEFYVKHLSVLNQIFRDTIIRFLGYLLTLVTEYEEEYNSQYKLASEKDQPNAQQSHRKFKEIFHEECALLPSLFKIIQQKVKHLLTLKNISNIDCLQFYRWITTLRYWQKFLDNIILYDPLLNHEARGPAEQPVQQLISIVRENIRKSIQVLGLQALLYELTVDYINVYHNNTGVNEVINTLQEDTWQSIEIPAQFGDILQALFNPDGTALNSSVTILDSSTNSSKGILNMSREKDQRAVQEVSATRVKAKIKLLKNNILIGGVRYKVSLSFLILCQSLGQYMKLARILSNVMDKVGNENKIASFAYQKLYNLIQVYCQKSKQLILDTKAISFGKIKGKTITAKHICLLNNCLSVVQKIVEEMFESEKIQSLGLAGHKKNTISTLQSTRGDLVSKLTSILYNRTEKEINDFLQQNQQQAANKTSNAIINSFLQMVEITDEYLQVQDVRQVLKSSFLALTQKFVIHLLLRGGKQKAEAELLVQRLKFLRKYFPSEYQMLLKEMSS